MVNALALAYCAGLIAFQNPPPPGTSARAIQQIINARGLQSAVRSRMGASGMSAQEVRQRLAQMGYDPVTLDPYMDSAAADPPQPTEHALAIARTLGMLEVETNRPAAATAPKMARVAPASLVPQPEERPGRLSVFGVSVFSRPTTQFQPITTGPVPSSYLVGPGDELALIITGDVELTYSLPVTREGFVIIPQVGQVWVNGLTLEGVRNQLYVHLSRVYSGVRRGRDATTHFDVSLGRLRMNQVFVTGDAAQPGSYLVSPVASVLSALYMAGGPTANGSFRDIRIVRAGRVVHRVDLYGYLMGTNGLESVRLEPGDVVFVPVHGDHVAVRGEVNRPAIYEMKAGETLYQLLRHAGHLTASAQLHRARITRILPPAERLQEGVDRVVIDAELSALLADSAAAPNLQPGDDVTILTVRNEVRNIVTAQGSVWHPGSFAFRPGMRAWDLLRTAGGPMPEAYLDRAHIVRLNPADSTLSVLPLSLDTTAAGEPAENPELREYDVVRVFSRAALAPAHYVDVRGAVRLAGRQPRFEGMTLRDAILRAGGLIRESYTGRAYISRLQPDSSRRMMAVPLTVDSLMLPLNGDSLHDYDIIDVYGLARFTDRFPVTITGEVRAPHQEDFQEGMTLRDLVIRAGGLTPMADLTLEIARLSDPANRAAGQTTRLIRLRADSSFVIPGEAARFYLGSADSLRPQQAGYSTADFYLEPFDHVTVRRIPELFLPRVVAVAGEVRYPGRYALETRSDRLRDVVLRRAQGLLPTAHVEGTRVYRGGRLVNVDMRAVLANARHRDNLVLLPGDSVHVPEYNPVVVVEGAVLTPSTVMFRPGENLEYYIENAGGYLDSADRNRVAVRFANGRAVTKKRVLLFWRSVPEPGPGSVVTVQPRTTPRQGLASALVAAAQVITTMVFVYAVGTGR